MLSLLRSRAFVGVAAVAALVSGFAALKFEPPACAGSMSPSADPDAASGCRAYPHPEPLRETIAHQQHLEIRNAPMGPGSLRKALEQKKALEAGQAKLAQAGNHWTPYGTGSLITDDPRFGIGALGLTENNGRVDAFDYDPVGKRLFAAVGTGGIWMSTDLGDRWTTIGDNLPTLANSAVAWTPANGGTILVGSGENTVGSSFHTGLGAFWSNDLGATWNQATGVPDGAASFKVAVDQSRPQIVYLATSKGLYRSDDAGRSYTNVALPTTPDCAGVTALGPCQLTNIVTGVAVQAPGGSTNVSCGAEGCPVIAAVGYFLGPDFPYPDGTTPRAPGNGLYKSSNGTPGSFAKLDVSAPNTIDPIGFAVPARMGRMTFGAVTGDAQDHNYLYALVQDAVLINGGLPAIDVPIDTSAIPVALLDSSVFNGIYVSPDFGESWIRMADNIEIALNPLTGSSLSVPTPLTTLGYQPGVQAWYNQWIKPDPTQQLLGVPTRLVFGLEEMWKNRITALPLDGVAQVGPDDFSVFGTYFGGNTCLFLNDPIPVCPTNNPPIGTPTTTHPDQHDGIFIPRDDGGVCLIVGNDGGVYRQCVGANEDFDNSKWGRAANNGFYTTLPYHLAVAKDGVVWFGLQDNGTAKIEPGNDYKLVEAFGGDGFYVAVDPDNSLVAYQETGGGSMSYTTDGGSNWVAIAPPLSSADFSNPFKLDPTDATHMITGGPEIMELVDAPSGNWIQVFNVGTDPATGGLRSVTNLAVRGDNAYAACAYESSYFFRNCLATNVGGEQPPKKGSGDGWHMATASGLPNRFITSTEMDPADPRTLYVTLGGYLTEANPPGGEQDHNDNIGVGNVYKSTDAGEHFHNVSGDLPIGTVNWVILRNAQMLVGTDIGAFISSDLEGTKWAVLGDLPNVPVTALQLHSSDPKTVIAATYGRGIWSYHFDSEIDLGGGTSSGGSGPGPNTERFGGAMPIAVLLFLFSGVLLRNRRPR